MIGKNTKVGINSVVDNFSKIGKYTYIGKNCDITKAKIGNYCSIANFVTIGPGEHNLNNVSTSSIFYDNGYEELTIQDCIIEHDVWIGTQSIILRGVIIKVGAVIGANSVVTKDIPEYAIAVGSPAKVIGYRFNDKYKSKILESQWFMKDKIEAKIIIDNLE